MLPSFFSLECPPVLNIFFDCIILLCLRDIPFSRPLSASSTKLSERWIRVTRDDQLVPPQFQIQTFLSARALERPRNQYSP